MLYGLGIGAGPSELDYVYEARGPAVYPTFGVVPSYPVLAEVVELSGGAWDRLVHGGQSVWVRGALPASGRLETQGEIVALNDLKRMAQLVYRTRTWNGAELVFETEGSLLFLGMGGFGGARPSRVATPKYSAKRGPDFEHRQAIAEQQALLYRLSGDLNPLHVDPAVAAAMGFPQGPILHGLSTFGYCARALGLGALGGATGRIRSFHAQFRKPVWPGETLVCALQRATLPGSSAPGLEGFALQAYAGGRPEAVVSGWAEVAVASGGA